MEIRFRIQLKDKDISNASQHDFTEERTCQAKLISFLSAVTRLVHKCSFMEHNRLLESI